MFFALTFSILASAFLLVPLIKKFSGARVLVSLPAGLAFFAFLFMGWPSLRSGEVITHTLEWFPSMGINLDFQLTGMGFVLGLLVMGIGALIMSYASGYMKGDAKETRLYLLLYSFMVAMVGLAVSNNLLLFFIFWELTSIISYLLVGFKHEYETSRKNALQALLITGGGGIAMLIGLVMLSHVGGAWTFTELTANAHLITESALYPYILTLVLLGAFTKSAQFPFHFWLPNAMGAPTPVSAYLHSATMVKAGIFLMFVMTPILGGTELWKTTLITTGSITLLVGGWFGLTQKDLKAILAGTTISVLGLITFLIGIGSDKAILAAILVMVAHALYKASLFMMVGAVDLATGTRNINELRGLKKWMPLTATAALLAGLSKMGLPPFYGFIAKEYLYKAAIPLPMEWIQAVLVLGNAIILALAIKVSIIPFFAKDKEKQESASDNPLHKNELDWTMSVSPFVLAILGVLFGAFPNLITPMVHTAVHSITPEANLYAVKLWSGVNWPLILSIFTVGLGLALFFSSRWLEKKETPKSWGVVIYERLLEAVLCLFKKTTRVVQSGYLQNYLAVILIATVALVAWKSIPTMGLWVSYESNLTLTPIIIITAVIMLISAFWICITKSKLNSIIALGVIGAGVALLFAYYSAPDLAITQLLVESLIVVMFAWVIKDIKPHNLSTPLLLNSWYLIISASFSLLIFTLVMKSKLVNLAPAISQKMVEMSYPEGFGSNVVNVTLVDFRALDTWGEATVISIAAIGVWILGKNLISKKS